MEASFEKIKKSIEKKIKDYDIEDKVKALDLGIIDYDEAFKIQEYLFQKVLEEDIKGFLTLLEHFPVITIGNNRNRSNLVSSRKKLEKNGIKLVQSNRGGDITFHGPGQLVGYPVLDLSEFKKDLSLYVYNLEEVVIRVLEIYGLEGKRIKGLRGVFLGKQKIASVGVRVKKWITMHGFSFNINPDLSYFGNIVACGLKDFTPTSLCKILDKDIPIDDVKEHTINCFQQVFDITMV